MDPGQTGVHFNNQIVENDTMNILVYEYVYNGGGVAIGDFNNDSLPDIFFTGNQVPNKLYLNKGNFSFEDISQSANIEASDRWCSGVTLVDINADGKLDMYITTTVHNPGSRRANLMYINEGMDEQGYPVFSEQASEMGIADTGHSVHAAFLDYDRDGDLDLYVLTNENDLNKTPNVYREKLTDGQNPNTDRLYRNNGDGTFTHVSREAGILIEGYGLGIAITDVNLDHWPDIYISNDYVSNDLLYINNQDGTFSNQVDHYFKHQSHSAMGNDVSDINNDGLVDILALDMQPEVNERKKRLTPANNYATYINNERYGYAYQYSRNTLQLNNGITPEGIPTFSEVGQLADIHETDWSWSPLIADLNHDGWKDILITNGFPKDITDLDFGLYRAETERLQSTLDLQSNIPVVKIANYAYQNEGNLNFTQVTQTWGMDIPSFSNGASLGDLDLDGDLDYVVNNINDSAFVFQNQLSPKNSGQHYLRLNLKGSDDNTLGIGTTILLEYGNEHRQIYQHYLSRGYLSAVEPVAHFGLGNTSVVDSIHILWPDGSYQLLTNISTNQELTVSRSAATESKADGWLQTKLYPTSQQMYFAEDTTTGLVYVHQEQDKVDFNLQRTLPHKFTQSGPSLSVADINGDGLDDLFIGGSANQAASAFLQKSDGSFTQTSLGMLTDPQKAEDMGTLWFDADQDGDQDLYIVSGSYEYPPGDTAYLDRFYRNEGNGKMIRDIQAIPYINASGSCVRAADIDRDGDLDLFIGGRVIPGSYPEPPKSYLLVNEKGVFVDRTHELAEGLEKIGMVNDALWTDIDNDGWMDLLLAGEWMPLTLYQNINGKLVNTTDKSGLGIYKGWWNSLAGADIDLDGDTDYIAGNLGLNTRYVASQTYPLSVYASDFDQNGSVDPILVCYIPNQEGEMAPYPMHTRDDLIRQMQDMRRRFPKYNDYGSATIHEVLTADERKQALYLEATHFASSYIENLGDGTFRVTPLPAEAQVAPVYGIQVSDFNLDGFPDILTVGNNYATEVFTGRYDASEGLLLLGDGTGQFTPQRPGKSGWYVSGDAKSLVKLISAAQQAIYISSQNQDSLVVTKWKIPQNDEFHILSAKPMDAWIEIYRKNRLQKLEWYYGSSFLSQSSRSMIIPVGVDSVLVYDFTGQKRRVEF